jgi:hypothetical protein
MKRRCLFGCTIFAYLTLVPNMLCASDETAQVTLHAVDEYGKGLGPFEVVKFVYGGGEGKDFGPLFVQGEASGIPYGRYFAEIKTKRFAITDWVEVQAPEVFAVLSGSGMFVEHGPGRAPSLTGRITGLPANVQKPLWIRIANIYQDPYCCNRTVLVAHDGSFSTNLLDVGQYVLLVLHDGGVLYVDTLRLKTLSSRIEVDVGAKVVNISDR